jgi:hypothetical protein
MPKHHACYEVLSSATLLVGVGDKPNHATSLYTRNAYDNTNFTMCGFQFYCVYWLTS